MRKKITILIIFVLMTILIPTTKVSASYNYTPWQSTIESAHSMSITRIIDSVNLMNEDGEHANITLDNLRDAFVYKEHLYVVDARANKVFVLNDKYEYVKEYPQGEGDLYNLNNPQGVFVANDLLYIADTDNDRIAIYNINTDNMIGQIKTPEDEIFETVPFKPQKIAVDRVGRIMVVSRDTFEGILEFDENRKFTRFFGTNTIQLSFFEALIYNLSSQSQRERMALNLQTPFTSIDIDEYGYIYAVARNELHKPVKKMNFKGEDILLNNGYIPIVGDTSYPTYRETVPLGPSTIVDITSHDDNNRFSILDSKRGRIFTYDMEGHLLYIFGGLDSQSKELQGPTSITYWGEKVIVTDNIAKSIFIYEPTIFGELVNSATTSYYDMQYEDSRKLWEEVLELNSNYFLAYAGIGKTQLRNQEWESAVENLKLGHDHYNYSKAYEQYRNEKISKYIPTIIVVVLVASAYGLFRSVRASIKRDKGEID